MSNPSLPDKAQEIRARCEQATKGPWFVDDDRANGISVFWKQDAMICPMRWTDGMRADVTTRVAADAEFIAHAREDMPWALDERDRLLDQLRAAQEEIAGWIERAKASDEDYAEAKARIAELESALRAQASSGATEECDCVACAVRCACQHRRDEHIGGLDACDVESCGCAQFAPSVETTRPAEDER